MGTVKESLARTEKGSEHWMAKLEEGGEVEVSAASNSRPQPQAWGPTSLSHLSRPLFLFCFVYTLAHLMLYI